LMAGMLSSAHADIVTITATGFMYQGGGAISETFVFDTSYGMNEPVGSGYALQTGYPGAPFLVSASGDMGGEITTMQDNMTANLEYQPGSSSFGVEAWGLDSSDSPVFMEIDGGNSTYPLSPSIPFSVNPPDGEFLTTDLDYSLTPINGYLTNITLTDASIRTAVPEPSTWAMTLIGFGLIGFTTYRSRMKATA
jgi:PEP-CTERM motif